MQTPPTHTHIQIIIELQNGLEIALFLKLNYFECIVLIKTRLIF